MITAADIRYCSADACFCVKEVDLAIAADMGTLQRLPGIVGQGGNRRALYRHRQVLVHLPGVLFPEACRTACMGAGPW